MINDRSLMIASAESERLRATSKEACPPRRYSDKIASSEWQRNDGLSVRRPGNSGHNVRQSPIVSGQERADVPRVHARHQDRVDIRAADAIAVAILREGCQRE